MCDSSPYRPSHLQTLICCQDLIYTGRRGLPFPPDSPTYVEVMRFSYRSLIDDAYEYIFLWFVLRLRLTPYLLGIEGSRCPLYSLISLAWLLCQN